MPIILSKHRGITAFAIIVDMNGFTKMVAHPEANLMAQFTHDVLYGGIRSVEKNNGDVVGFMGDAFLAILMEADDVFKCCVSIAKDIDQQCEYISNSASAFPYAPKGPSLKIGIEYGYMDVSEIGSNFLGDQKLLIGEAINYAARITVPGKGNRCHFGQKAFEMGLSSYTRDKAYSEVKGKKGEQKYKYYQLDLGDVWIEGKSKESYWG